MRGIREFYPESCYRLGAEKWLLDDEIESELFRVCGP
jgi:hypothetical protein